MTRTSCARCTGRDTRTSSIFRVGKGAVRISTKKIAHHPLSAENQDEPQFFATKRVHNAQKIRRNTSGIAQALQPQSGGANSDYLSPQTVNRLQQDFMQGGWSANYRSLIPTGLQVSLNSKFLSSEFASVSENPLFADKWCLFQSVNNGVR